MNRRKELSAAYKQRTLRGGVYVIRNTTNAKYILGSALDLQSVHNRFAFAVSTRMAPHPALRDDWRALGPQAFTLEVLEELEQGKDQSEASFREDVALLESIWREKLDASLAY